MGKYDGASASKNGYVSNGENHPKMIQNQSTADDIRKIFGHAKNNVENPTMIMPAKELKAIRELDEKRK